MDIMRWAEQFVPSSIDRFTWSWIERCTLSLVDRFTFGIIANFNEIMDFRQSQLEMAYKGLIDSGIPLIVENGPNQFSPAGYVDDIGFYYWIPQIAHWLNIDIPQAYNCLSTCLLFMACVLGALGIFLCFEQLTARLIGLGILFLFFKTPVPIALNYAVSMIICGRTLSFLCTKKTREIKALYMTNLNIAFILAISLSLLPAILVVPSFFYASDFIVLCSLYAVFGYVSVWQLRFILVRYSSKIVKKIFDSQIKKYSSAPLA